MSSVLGLNILLNIFFAVSIIAVFGANAGSSPSQFLYNFPQFRTLWLWRTCDELILDTCEWGSRERHRLRTRIELVHSRTINLRVRQFKCLAAKFACFGYTGKSREIPGFRKNPGIKKWPFTGRDPGNPGSRDGRPSRIQLQARWAILMWAQWLNGFGCENVSLFVECVGVQVMIRVFMCMYNSPTFDIYTPVSLISRFVKHQIAARLSYMWLNSD